MSDLDLTAIEARVNAATEGPWELWADDDDVIGNVVARSYPSAWPVIRTPLHDPTRAGIDTPDEFANVEFIAAARRDVPDLLAEVARLELLVEDLKAELRGAQQ